MLQESLAQSGQIAGFGNIKNGRLMLNVTVEAMRCSSIIAIFTTFIFNQLWASSRDSQGTCTKIISLIEEGPQELRNHFRRYSISQNCYKIGIIASVRQNNIEALKVFLEQNRFLSPEEELRIVAEAMQHKSTEAVIMLASLGYFSNGNGRRQSALLQRLIWTSDYHWDVENIEELMKLKASRCLLGQLNLLIDMPTADLAILYCKLLLEQTFKTSDAIIWYLALNKVKRLDDKELMKLFKYLLHGPFSTARAVWLHYQLVKNFAQTYDEHMITLSILLEDPRVVVNSIAHQPCTHATANFVTSYHPVITACKKGSEEEFQRLFNGVGNHPMILDILLRCTWSSTPGELTKRAFIGCILPKVFEVPMAARHALQQYPALSAVWNLSKRMMRLLQLDEIQPDDIKSLIVNLLIQMAYHDVVNGLISWEQTEN